MNALVRRRILAALFVVFGPSLAQAQSGFVDVTPKSPAQELACLVRQAPAPIYPERNALDHDRLQMRVLLRFAKPDAAPQVQVLMVNTARHDIREQVERYLAGYRLPCLAPADGVVSAVQEFSFDNSQRAPLPFDEESQEADRCLVVPPLRGGRALFSPRPAKVLLEIRFAGDGSQDPEVKVLYAARSEREFTRYAVAQASRYSMPCRTAADRPVVLEQVFTFAPAGASVVGFGREVMGLMEFLGMTQDVERLDADFDFSTMGCPFKLNYEHRSPLMPNRVTGGGRADPNRVAFVTWLAERRLSFKDDKQAGELFGSVLQIDIPCGVLSLHPEPAKAG